MKFEKDITAVKQTDWTKNPLRISSYVHVFLSTKILYQKYIISVTHYAVPPTKSYEFFSPEVDTATFCSCLQTHPVMQNSRIMTITRHQLLTYYVRSQHSYIPAGPVLTVCVPTLAPTPTAGLAPEPTTGLAAVACLAAAVAISAK